MTVQRDMPYGGWQTEPASACGLSGDRRLGKARQTRTGFMSMASERCRNDRLAELLRRQFSGEIVRRHLRIRCNGMRCYSRSSCGS